MLQKIFRNFTKILLHENLRYTVAVVLLVLVETSKIYMLPSPPRHQHFNAFMFLDAKMQHKPLRYIANKR